MRPSFSASSNLAMAFFQCMLAFLYLQTLSQKYRESVIFLLFKLASFYMII